MYLTWVNITYIQYLLLRKTWLNVVDSLWCLYLDCNQTKPHPIKLNQFRNIYMKILENVCNDSDFQYSEHGDISLSHFNYVLQQSKQFMKFLWNCLQITVKTQQPWLNLCIIVQTKDCIEYAILTNIFDAPTESTIPKNKNNKNKLHTNAKWFFIRQTNFIQYRNSNIAVCFFFFCSLLNLLTNSLAAELAYPLNGNIWRINICAHLTSIWQITSFCTVFVYVSARRHFLLLQLTS